MKAATKQAYTAALLNTEIPKLNPRHYTRNMNNYAITVVYKVLKHLGWEDEDATEAAANAKGTPKQRLRHILGEF